MLGLTDDKILQMSYLHAKIDPNMIVLPTTTNHAAPPSICNTHTRTNAKPPIVKRWFEEVKVPVIIAHGKTRHSGLQAKEAKGMINVVHLRKHNRLLWHS